MNKILGIACLAMLLTACASSGSSRPSEGPGSGQGATYVPVVDPPPPPSAAYDAVVDKCQREGAGLPFMKTQDHDAAIFVVNAATALAVGAGVYSLTGETGSESVKWIGSLIAGGTTFVGMQGLFGAWVYSPQVATWHQKQETQIANCMARNGFTNADPTVAVTYQPYTSDRVPPRVTGKDTYTAEHVAKLNNCAANPIAKLVSKGPGYENHAVACSNGTVIVVHCEFGNCRINEKVASN